MIWSSFKVKGKYLSGKVTLSIYCVLLIQLSLGSSPCLAQADSPLSLVFYAQVKLLLTLSAAETSSANFHSLSVGWNSALPFMPSPAGAQRSALPLPAELNVLKTTAGPGRAGWSPCKCFTGPPKPSPKMG